MATLNKDMCDRWFALTNPDQNNPKHIDSTSWEEHQLVWAWLVLEQARPLVRQIHEYLKRGKATQDHGIIGNLKCILDCDAVGGSLPDFMAQNEEPASTDGVDSTSQRSNDKAVPSEELSDEGIDALRKDAERYRWLKNNCSNNGIYPAPVIAWNHAHPWLAIDEFIDAAMEAKK